MPGMVRGPRWLLRRLDPVKPEARENAAVRWDEAPTQPALPRLPEDEEICDEEPTVSRSYVRARRSRRAVLEIDAASHWDDPRREPDDG